MTLLGKRRSLNEQEAIHKIYRLMGDERVEHLTITLVGSKLADSRFSKLIAPDMQPILNKISKSVRFTWLPRHERVGSERQEGLQIARLGQSEKLNGIIMSKGSAESSPFPPMPSGAEARGRTLEAVRQAEQRIFDDVTLLQSQDSRKARHHFEQVQQRLAELAVSPGSGLTEDFFPFLRSLKKRHISDHRIWSLEFYDPVTKVKKALPIHDRALVTAVRDINARVRQEGRAVKKIRAGAFSALDGAGDGMGVAMTLGSLAYQLFRTESMQQGLEASMSEDQRRILEAQVMFGILNEGVQGGDALLTFGKYALALKTKKFIPLTHRMANVLEKTVRTSALGSAGKSATPLVSRVLRLSGPATNLFLSGAAISLDIGALSACETRECRENAGIMLGLDLATATPLVVALGAKALGGKIIAATTAASISSAAGAVALPVTAVATILIIGQQLKEAKRQEFVNFVSGLPQQMYEDLIFKGAWDASTQTLNLFSRFSHNQYLCVTHHSKQGVYQETKRKYHRQWYFDNIERLRGWERWCGKGNDKPEPVYASRLAPIVLLDFDNKKVGYGQIRIHKIKNQSGRIYLNSDASGPAIGRRVNFYGCDRRHIIRPSDETFNLLSNQLVLQQLLDHRQWPEGKITTVVLPSTRDWKLAKWSPHHIPVSDATKWGWDKPGREGWEMFMNAGSYGGSKEQVNRDFTFAFYPRLRGDRWIGGGHNGDPSCRYSDGSMQEANVYIIKNLDSPKVVKPSSIRQVTTVKAASYEQHFIIPDKESSYRFYGKDGYKYTVAIPWGGQAIFYAVGQEQWTVLVRGGKKLTLSDFRYQNDRFSLAMTDGDNAGLLEFHGFSTLSTNPYPVVIIDDIQYRYHVLDRKAGRFKTYFPELEGEAVKDHKTRFFIRHAYQQPDGEMLNRPSRFYQSGESQWLDVLPEELTVVTVSGQEGYLLYQDKLFAHGLACQGYTISGPVGQYSGYSLRWLVEEGPFQAGELFNINRLALDNLSGLTDKNGSLQVLTGQVWMDAGEHHYTVQSKGVYYSLSIDGQRQQHSGPNSPGTITSSVFVVDDPGLYSFEFNLLLVDKMASAVEVRLDGEVLGEQRLFNDQKFSSAIDLPDDLEPISGFPDSGYLFYSTASQQLFYRQPLSESKGGLIQLPSHYVGRIDRSSDHLQGRFKSTTGTIFQLTIEPSEGLFKPKMAPVQFNWSHNYQAAVAEIRYFSAVSNLIPALVFFSKESDRLCGFGYYDPHEDLALWMSLNLGTVHFEVLEPSRKARESLMTGCHGPAMASDHSEGDGSQKGKGLDFPLFIASSKTHSSRRYLFFRQSSSRLYLVDIPDGSLKGSHSVVPVTMSLGLNAISFNYVGDHKESRKTSLLSDVSRYFNTELLGRVDDGAIVSVHAKAFEQALQTYRGGQRGRINIDITRETVSLVGVYCLDAWQKLTPGDMSKTLFTLVEGYQRYVSKADQLKEGWAVLPLQGYIPRAFKGESDVSSWYVHNKARPRVYSVQGRKLNMLAYDPRKMRLYGYDHDLKKAVSVHLGVSGRRQFNNVGYAFSKENFPEPKVYCDYQFEHQSLFIKGHHLYVQGEHGLTVRLKKSGPVLIAMDLNAQVKAIAPDRRRVETFTNELAQIVNGKLKLLPVAEIPTRIELDVSKELPRFQAWYHSGASSVATQGVTVFEGDEPVVMLGSSGMDKEKVSWFYAADSGNLYRQSRNGQELVGRFPEVSLGEGGSLAITGTSASDYFVEIRVGSGDTGPTLYLRGEGGADRFLLSLDMVHHYSGIVIDTSLIHSDRPRQQALRPITSTMRTEREAIPERTPAESSTVNIDLPANEFSADLGEKALQLYHFPTGHTLSFPASYNWQTMNTGRFDDFRFINGNVQLLFKGQQFSLNELLKTALLQPDTPWQLPVDVEQLSDGHRLRAHPDHTLKLQIPEGYRLTGFHGKRRPGFWTLSFKTDMNKKSFVVDDRGFRAARQHRFWVSTPSFEGHFIPLTIVGHYPPGGRQQLWPTLKASYQRRLKEGGASADGFPYSLIRSREAKRRGKPIQQTSDR